MKMDNKKNSEKIKHILQEIELFRHSAKGKVRFSEVDSFGVVHNIQYFFWLESARTEYLGNLGIDLNPDTYIDEFPVMVVHAEIDYFNALRFNESYEVLTRISSLGETSLTYENLILKSDGLLLAKAKAVLVHLDPGSKTPARIPDKVREMINSFEHFS